MSKMQLAVPCDQPHYAELRRDRLSLGSGGKLMPTFHVIAGPDATPDYPVVRKIGPADLKDALARGIDDFWAIPTSLIFLGLIYPIVGASPVMLCPCFFAHVRFRSGWSLRGNWLVRDKPAAGARP
jgi:hypothetical protein